MDAFNFVFSLFGLLLGLALAEVLGGLATALESRRKLHVGWLTPLLGLIVALDLISFWSIAWDVRDKIPARYFSLLCGLLVTGIYYLVARLAFPRDRDQWPDYDVYYFAHKRLVLGGIILCNLLATAGEAVLGVDPFTPGFALWSTVLFYGLMLAAFIAPGAARQYRPAGHHRGDVSDDLVRLPDRTGEGRVRGGSSHAKIGGRADMVAGHFPALAR